MISLDISRVKVALHGISAQVVEEATSDLESELKRRLGVLPVGDMASINISELAIGPVPCSAVLDAETLRCIIAERLAQGIRSRLEGRESEMPGSSVGGV